MRNSGSALLTALFIMSIVAIIATALTVRTQGDIQQVHAIIQHDKQYLAAQAVKYWAINQLLTHPKPARFPTSRQIYPGLIIDGEIKDLQAQFNINNLYQQNYQLLFSRLLKHAAPKMNLSKRLEIVSAITQWIVMNPPAHDKFLDQYMRQHYFPGYQPMHSLSELRLVSGITPQIYHKIVPYITTLPEITPLNIMTISPEILKTLGNELTKNQINKILELRDPNYSSLAQSDEERYQPLIREYNIQTESITFKSQYFLVVAHVQDAGHTYTWYTTLSRKIGKNNQPHIDIIREGNNL